MRSLIKRSLVVGVLAVAVVAFSATTAQAQFAARPINSRAFPTVQGRPFPSAQSLNPSFVPTQLQRDSLRQWSRDVRFIGRTYAQLPPWLFGYNPYPPINYGPVYRYPVYPVYPPPYVPPYYPPYDGYVNPYASPYSGGYTNPYANPYAFR